MTEFFANTPGRFFLVATLLPLAASLLMIVFALFQSVRGRVCRIPNIAAYFVFVAMFSASICSVFGLIELVRSANNDALKIDDGKIWNESVNWLTFGSNYNSPAVKLGYRIDLLNALAITMVCIVTTLIVLFSIGYMYDEEKPICEDHVLHIQRRGRFGKFFLLLGLFAFSMLNLLIADNLLQVFISWELVGVCSFFLIGFYSERKSASLAANKAFVINRIGDAGFLIALFIAWTQFKTFDIQLLNQVVPASLVLKSQSFDGMITLLGLGLFLGCIGKSAQVPLQTWLPDAMEGPTPVSALIHAATMVAAGVYLVGRAFPMFDEKVLMVVAVLGAITAFISATTALVQFDIKRILAFSTCSQLGLMMMALGLGAWTAALFHLLTHAFFKALLFLCSGSVIHACHHEQDIRQMGGLRKNIPVTAYTMLIGVLAISGMPFFSGWYSKDQIVGYTLGYISNFGYSSVNILIAVFALLTVLMTAYYMTRLWLLTFTGQSRNEQINEHAHESPVTMLIPLIVLAVFSVVVGWGLPLWSPEHSYLSQLIEKAEPRVLFKYDAVKVKAHDQHLLSTVVAFGLAACGAAFAVFRFRSGAMLDYSDTQLRQFLENRWYADEAYDVLLKQPILSSANVSSKLDKAGKDVGSQGVGYSLTSLDGWLASFATFISSVSAGLKRVQTGSPRAYIIIMALTAITILGILSRYIR